MLNVLMVALCFIVAGCGVKAETYVMSKERVDLERVNGNAGYLKGDPKYTVPEKKTRKVYILELTKPLKESEVKKIEEVITTHTSEVNAQAMPQAQVPSVADEEAAPAPIVVPVIDDVVASNPQQMAVPENGPGVDETYTVLKDDTLQKIAKKFYGSYGKWIKIYEANKDKIKNPNFVKPGTVLVIPSAEKK